MNDAKPCDGRCGLVGVLYPPQHTHPEHAAEPPGETDELREQLAEWLFRYNRGPLTFWDQISEESRESRRDDADQLLDLPAVRALLDDAARVRDDTAVWIDPARRSGEPCIGGTRVPVDMIAGIVWEHGIPEALTQWPQMSRAQVLVACWYQATYRRAVWRRRWGQWASEAHEGLWRGVVDAVPDPPSRALDGDGGRG